MVEQTAGLAILAGKQIASAGRVDQALVDMHRAARLVGHGLGHKGAIHTVAQRGLAQHPLEQHHLVGQRQRITVLEVDLHLAGALFVDQGIQIQIHRLAIVVHLLEQRIELVDRIDGETLAATFLATGAPHRRFQRVVGVGVGLDQEELHLRCHHRDPASCLVQLQHPLEHVARRQLHRLTAQIVAVVDDLGGGIVGPGHQKDGVGVGHQLHVPLGRVPEADVLIVGIAPGDGLDKDGVRQARSSAVEVLARGHDLALEDAGKIGDQALDLGDAILLEPVAERWAFLAVTHESVPLRECLTRWPSPDVVGALSLQGGPGSITPRGQPVHRAFTSDHSC